MHLAGLDSIQNESIEKICGRIEIPAQMLLALGTTGYPPLIAREPRIGRRSLAANITTQCLAKTADVKFMLVWVGAMMAKIAIDRDGEIRLCDGV